MYATPTRILTSIRAYDEIEHFQWNILNTFIFPRNFNGKEKNDRQKKIQQNPLGLYEADVEKRH